MMEPREVWDLRIARESQRLNFRDGYKILYVPWSTIGRTDTSFLSLMPSRPPEGADLCTISDERGNSYEIERDVTRSQLTEQFLALAELIERRPSQILTGTISPYRADNWSSISAEQKEGALAMGRAFWEQLFTAYRPRQVIACGPEAANAASDILSCEFELAIPSGWGNTKLTRYRATDGAAVVQIPNLSRFKLLSRHQCHDPLRSILEIN